MYTIFFRLLQMDFSSRFQEATSSKVMKIDALKINREYPIIRAMRMGSTAVLSIQDVRDFTNTLFSVILPNR